MRAARAQTSTRDATARARVRATRPRGRAFARRDGERAETNGWHRATRDRARPARGRRTLGLRATRAETRKDSRRLKSASTRRRGDGEFRRDGRRG